MTGVSTLTPQQHQQFQQVVVANQQQQNQNTLSHQTHAQSIQGANNLPLLVSVTAITATSRAFAKCPLFSLCRLAGPTPSEQPATTAINEQTNHNESGNKRIDDEYYPFGQPITAANRSVAQMRYVHCGAETNLNIFWIFRAKTGNVQPIKTNNNAAIISLLNSAPAAMTSSTVVNNINNTPSSSPMTLAVQSNSTNQTMDGSMQQTTTMPPKATHVGQTTRKISLPSNQLQATVAGAQNRLLNQTNLIAVNANTVLGTTGQMVGIQAPNAQHCAQTLLSPDAQGNQQLSVRVTMSALASQLASPPAMMSAAINPQNYNFAQLKQTTQTQQQQQPQQQQQIILSGNVATTTNRYQSVRRDSMAAPSPGSDSNASNASSSNLGCSNSFTINPGFPFLGPATSPTTSVISNDGSTCQLSNQSASGLAERLNTSSNSISHHSPLSTGGGPSPLSSASSTHFMAPSPKSNLSQHIQVQSPASISPLSSPPLQVIQTQQPQSQSTTSFAVTTANVDRGVTRGLSNSQTLTQNHDGNAQQQTQQTHVQPQTTTLNLQGINLQSLQGAMATFPGLQNVQVRFRVICHRQRFRRIARV